MLEPYTVLDFTDDRGEIAGMILGDLGANVIRVETPSGSRSRCSGPLGKTSASSLASLQFQAYNRNKRSIALDPESAADQTILERLVARGHIILESAPGGGLAEFDMDFKACGQLNADVVFVQISPFGADGPRADYVGNDLVIAAMGGPVGLQGVKERSPVRLSVPQVWRHAGAEAAAGALLGLQRRLRSGGAQFVDVSAQAAMTWTMLNSMTAHAIQGFDFQRSGGVIQTGSMAIRLVYPTTDGYIVAAPYGRLMKGCLDWMIEDGVADPSLRALDWEEYDLNLRNPDYGPFGVRQAEQICEKFFAGHTKEELFRYGLEHGAALAPVNSLEELVAFDHLQVRGFWQQHDGNRRPGVWVKSPNVELGVHRKAPGLDEHGQEIRAWLKQPAKAPEVPVELDGELPFAGVTVADFTWAGVGPISAKFLADHGADVISVESGTRPDMLRGSGPFKDGEPGWNRSQFYGDFNTSKRSLSLDLKQPAALDLARQLIKKSDVMIESFAPGAMQRMGLTYDKLIEHNPGLIMISTSLMGQTGPAARLAGFGYHAGAIAGFYEVTGWPDLGPNGPWVAYTDTIAPRFISALLVAALDHRRRTGRGSYFDLAQIETALQFLAPELSDLQENGYPAGRMGNRSRFAAPQGCYPCAGEDEWCAIAIDTQEQWQALCAELELQRVADLSLEERQIRHDEIDARISRWTKPKDRYQVMEQLQALGVPAGVVQRSKDLLADPQYTHRGFYRWIEHPEMGEVPYAGHQYTVRGYDNAPRGPAPCLGADSFAVLSEVLGLGDEQIAAAYASGAIN